MYHDILQQLTELGDEMTAHRRALHQIPELAWNVPATSAYVENALREIGLDPILFYDKILTAAVGRPGAAPTVMIRAEMDALPVQEQGSLPFRPSTRNSHCSGHDLHMAMSLGLARALQAHAGALPGQVIFLFQPAGETAMGCKFILSRGILDALGVRAVLAIHLNSATPTGCIQYQSGIVTSYLDAFYISLTGRGSRGYAPHDGVTPLEMAAHIQLILGSLVQREVDAREHVVLSIGKAGGGTVTTHIPDTAQVWGTMRCFCPEIRSYLMERVREVAGGVAAAYRGEAAVEFNSTPALINDEGLARSIAPALSELLGPDRFLRRRGPTIGSEDLSYLSQCLPTAFLLLGGSVPGTPGLFDEAVMVTGAQALAASLFGIWGLAPEP